MTSSDRRMFLKQSTGALAAIALLPEAGWAAPRLGSEPVNVALVGAGRQGRAILAELQKIETVTVVAVCDANASRLRSGLRRVQGAKGYEDHRAMLEGPEGIQAVFIATPTHAHRDIAIDCLAAGKHVYCEAPLAHTIEDCRAIADAARGSDRVFHGGLQARSNPVYQLARGFFLTDSVRDLISMRAHEHEKRDWRVAASTAEAERELNWRLDPELSLGLVGELGTHQFDVFHWYTRQYPVSVSGHGSVRLYRDGRSIADTVQAGLVFEDNSLLLYEASLCNSYEGRYEVFHGSNAAIRLAWSHGWMFKEADAPTQGWEVYANRQQFHNDEGITLIADATQLASQGKLKEGVGLPHPSLYYAIVDFLKSITEGEPVVCSADESMRATIVGIHAARAVRDRTNVQIDHGLFGQG